MVFYFIFLTGFIIQCRWSNTIFEEMMTKRKTERFCLKVIGYRIVRDPIFFLKIGFSHKPNMYRGLQNFFLMDVCFSLNSPTKSIIIDWYTILMLKLIHKAIKTRVLSHQVLNKKKHSFFFKTSWNN